MATKIRLQLIGKRDNPFFRIVMTDKSVKRNGKIKEYLGYIDPKTKPVTIKVDNKKLSSLLAKGAQPTETVRKLLSL